MMLEQSLLDLLTIQMRCTYLSDLQFLLPAQRYYLSQVLERLTPREEDLRDWNDTLEYLTGMPPEKTAVEAKQKLIEQLRLTKDKQ